MLEKLKDKMTSLKKLLLIPALALTIGCSNKNLPEYFEGKINKDSVVFYKEFNNILIIKNSDSTVTYVDAHGNNIYESYAIAKNGKTVSLGTITEEMQKDIEKKYLKKIRRAK